MSRKPVNSLYFWVQVNQQRQKLHDLQTLIDNLGTGQDTVTDKAFENRLKEAERAIVELLDEARSSKGKISSANQPPERHLHLN